MTSLVVPVGSRVALAAHAAAARLRRAGLLVLDRDPPRTREILTSVEHAGRQALTELDRMLSVDLHGGGERGGFRLRAVLPAP